MSKGLTARRFGNLVFTEPSEKLYYWKCTCDCGGTCIVTTNGLKLGLKTNCGCKPQDLPPRQIVFQVWRGLRARCCDPNNRDYSNYGGRGIKVCDDWINDFEAFYKYIGDKPYNDYSLDRINNDGNYEPGNVRWASKKIQSTNQRLRKSIITIDFIRECVELYRFGLNMSQIAEKFSISQSSVSVALEAYKYLNNEKIMARCKELKNQLKTYREITKILNLPNKSVTSALVKLSNDT